MRIIQSSGEDSRVLCWEAPLGYTLISQDHDLNRDFISRDDNNRSTSRRVAPSPGEDEGGAIINSSQLKLD